MISPAEAETLIREHVRPLSGERVALSGLVGRVLRETIVCTRDQPPFDRVTMDGIAFSQAAYLAADRRELRVAGTQAAGTPPLELGAPNDCFEVMTGAMLPIGCDCVVPIEKIELREGYAVISRDATIAAHANVHARGFDCKAGDALLRPGMLLGPAEVAVIAANGHADALVSRQPSIVIVSTGDELVQPGLPVREWQIHRSNAFALMAALRRRGLERIAEDHLPDDLATLRARLMHHLDQHDLLILSGGVSMGRFDYVPEVLTDLGVQRIYHKVAQRPGKPMWFGTTRAGKPVFALPGNPVSTLVCLARYVFAGLESCQAQMPRAPMQLPLARDFEVKAPLTFFLPVKLTHGSAVLAADPRPTGGSGDFTSLVATDGFVELPPGPQVVAAGTAVPFHAW